MDLRTIVGIGGFPNAALLEYVLDARGYRVGPDGEPRLDPRLLA